MRFRVLGPVEAFHADERLSIRAGRERSLLALLLFKHDEPVPVERIIDLLWDDPPDSARAQIQNIISRLRRIAPLASAIETTSSGYRLLLGEHELDLEELRRHVRTGNDLLREGRCERAAETFTAALAHWRGSPLADCVEPMAGLIRPTLVEELLGAVEAKLDAQLASGEHEAVLPEVGRLLIEHPFRENLYRLQMMSLAAAGRRIDALETYRTARRVLREHLDVEPGAMLRQLHEELRTGDATPTPGREAAPRVPRQLPPEVDVLVGRDKVEVAARDALAGEDTSAIRVVAFTGQGGIGKSAVAVKVAHALADTFPDGQLYANLHGSQSRPVDPHELTGRFLRDFGVPGADVPADPDERIAAYRSLVATRRVLLLLDDAADAAQVRQLLPGTSQCAVIVTARHQLGALSGATVFRLSTMAPSEAVELLGRVIGPDRVARDPAAAEALAELCGHLPLALRIAGARLADRRDRTLGDFCDRLAGVRARLDELAVGDLDVRATIAMSYRLLPEDARCALRRLALLDARSMPAWVLAALTGGPQAHGEVMLDQLIERNLIEVAGTDGAGQWRYRMHDLVHEFCRERAHDEDTEDDRVDATVQALRGWLTLAVVGSENLRHGGSLEPVSDVVEVAEQALEAARAEPFAWYAAERANLVAGVHIAAGLGLTALASDLALRVIGYLHLRDYEADREAITRAAIDSWQHTGKADRRLFLLYRSLFSTLLEQDRFVELQLVAEQAVNVAARIDDDVARAEAADGLAIAAAMAGRMPEALRIYRQCVADAERLDLPERVRRKSMWGVAWVLGQLGRAHESAATSERYLPAECVTRRDAIQLFDYAEVLVDAGRVRDAEEALCRSLLTFREIGDRNCATHVERVSAVIDFKLGDLPRARQRLLVVATELREMGDLNGVAEVCRTLADVAMAAGEPRSAIELLVDALAIWRGLDAPLQTARTLARLGLAQRAIGDPEAAAATEREWRVLLEERDLPLSCLRLPEGRMEA